MRCGEKERKLPGSVGEAREAPAEELNLQILHKVHPRITRVGFPGSEWEFELVRSVGVNPRGVLSPNF